MDFTFSAEQEDLRAAVRAALTNEAGSAYVRRMIDDDRGVDEQLWRTFAELGWLGTLVPAEHGGLGLGLVDAVVVQEEMGRLPMPGPYFSSAILATLAATRLGADDLLADLASGAARGTVAVEEWGSGDPLDSVATTATRAGDGFVLDGLKPVVLDAHVADWVVVVARDTSSDDGALAGFLVEAGAATAARVPALDVTRATCRLELVATPARRLGPAGDQRATWRRILDDASIALCAETLGACEAAYAMAVEYATQRVQFDRPIGSFQVIRHKLVDMLHQLTLAQVGVHWAAWASDVDDPERAHAAAMCKAFVDEAAVFVTAENIQVHGGVGFTWDVDAHLYYRRVKQNDALLGAHDWQRGRLADLVLG
jgi:alkylation response protein AidB-like acyl-CoA dehydrogenase